jgi:predicted metalloprotease with PDZ domain
LAVAIIGDIPYKQYTFIAIGPGRGGIEHLNNTTVRFEGNGLYNLIVKRAGIVSEQTLFNNFGSSINIFENSPGRMYQSLTQSSFEIWNV